MDDEPPDFTDRYNTPLSPGQEQTFQTWVANRSNATGRDVGRDLFDYDVRGQWLAGQAPKPGEHGTDTFKKPNHPTFSEYSQYHGADDHRGGQWLRQGDAWAYRPSRTNLDMYGSAGLGRYFSEREPETTLMMPGRADGGEIAPTSATEAPQAQAMIQRFTGMPMEQLQELTARLGPASQVGQLAQRVLRQKRTMPTIAESGFGHVGGRGMPRPPAAPTFEDPLKAAGGDGLSSLKGLKGIFGEDTADAATGYAAGGMPHLGKGAMPLAAHDALRSMAAPPTRGFLAGATPGRTDSVMGKPAANSYVIPADVVSHFGQGSSLAGANALKAAFSTGPQGTSLPRPGGGRGTPRPPPAFHMARGGEAPEKVDVALSDGEFVVSPEEVAAIGGGNYKRGHAILDKLVVHARKRLIKTLQKLPGPIRE